MPDRPSAARDTAPVTSTLRAGETLFHEGERHGTLFIVESGHVELLVASGRGLKQVALLGRGDIVGDDAGLDRRPSHFTARAVSDVTLLPLDRSTFEDLVRVRPEVARVVLAAQGRRLAEARVAAATSPLQATADSPVKAEPAAPRFVHVQSDTTLALPPGDSILIGRSDEKSSFCADLDLSSLDGGRSLSRRHAVLQHVSGRYQVIEQPRVANGTFVNGTRVTPGVPVPISDGDEVRFGLVRLVFRIG
jgi:CRP-like cAMP-binding protein